MKVKSLPFLPQSLAKSYHNLIAKDFKILQASTANRLGAQLLDFSLLALQTEEKVKVLIPDLTTKEAFIQRAQEVGLIPHNIGSGKIYLEWSEDIYPSQKILALGKVFPKLNQVILGKTLLDIIAAIPSVVALPLNENLNKSPLESKLFRAIESAYMLYNPLVDYDAIKQLIVDKDRDLTALKLEVKGIEDKLEDVLKVLKSVDSTFDDAHSLRRMNHSSHHPVIHNLYGVYKDLDDKINSLTQVAKVPMKRPLNAAMLTTYLYDQVRGWYHKCKLLSSSEVIDWLDIVIKLPKEIEDSVWVFAQYKIQQPWQDVILRQKAGQNLSQIEYHSSRMKFDDCQHLHRVLIGNLQERLEVVNDLANLDHEESTLTFLPHNLHHSVSNPFMYETISSIDDLPVLNSLYTGGQLNDSQLLSNAKYTAKLLAKRVPLLEIYVDKSKIIISLVLSLDKDVSQFLLENNFSKIKNGTVEENLMECLVDVNRKVYILILGSLIAIDNLSDWVYQIQLLEHIEATGITVIDIPIHIGANLDNPFIEPIHSILNRYVED